MLRSLRLTAAGRVWVIDIGSLLDGERTGAFVRAEIAPRLGAGGSGP